MPEQTDNPTFAVKFKSAANISKHLVQNFIFLRVSSKYLTIKIYKTVWNLVCILTEQHKYGYTHLRLAEENIWTKEDVSHKY